MDGTIDESQATQLIESVLHPVNHTTLLPTPHNPEDDSDLVPSSLGSIPQYQHHGLANTQTQTDLNSVDSIYGVKPEGSLKENLSVHERAPCMELTSGGRCPKGDAQAANDAPLTRDNISPHKVAQSRHAQRTERPRSLSPVSQDSLGDPLILSPKQKAIRNTSKVFQRPLTQMGRSEESDSSDLPPGLVVPMDAPLHPSRTPSSPTSSPSVRATPFDSSPLFGNPLDQSSQPDAGSQDEDAFFTGGQGNISSQELYGHSQPSAYYPDLPPTRTVSPGYQTTEPNSSFNLSHFEDSEPEEPMELVPTQITESAMEYEETQPSDFVGVDINPAKIVTYAADEEITTSSIQTSRIAEPSNKRTLLSMVGDKKWRFEQFQALASSRGDTSTIADTQLADAGTESRVEPTQVDGSSMDSSDIVPSSTALGVTQPVRLPSPVPLVSPHIRKEPRSQDIDVVPDSVAPHTDRSSTEPETELRQLSTKGKGRVGAIAVRKEEEEEDDDGDDDDIPLSKVQRKSTKEPEALSRSDSGLQMPPPPPPKLTAPPSTAVTKVKRGAAVKGKLMKTGGSWTTIIIPSSNPNQDATKVLSPVKTRSGQRRAPSSSRSVTPAASKGLSPIGSEDALSDLSSCQTSGDRDTEPADDNDMDVDIKTESLVQANRKRKRTASSSTSKRPGSRSSARTTKNATPGPTGRPAKRIKVSSVARSGSAQATRVFALWKQDAHYYPGTVHSLESGTKYCINFDDGTSDTVEISNMRFCELKQGDHILYEAQVGKYQKAVVVEGISEDREVTVTVDVNGFTKQCEIPVESIKIASRTLVSEWRDRKLTVDDIIPIVKPKAHLVSPSPSKVSLASAGSSRYSKKFLAKTGVVVTLCLGNSNWEKAKDKLFTSVRKHGGMVIDDWGQVFNLDGNHALSGKRWSANSEDVVLLQEGLDRIFLISDDANRKPKFLIALALGIPCVSLEWLNDSVSEEKDKDWRPYLLPAGFCESLHARVSQMVDLDWGNSPAHLGEIGGNKVPSKVFKDQTILCISQDFVPLPKISRKGTSDAEKAKEAHRLVPRIILCMGASYVEAVGDPKFASKLLKKFDYVVVKEESDVDRYASNEVNCVHFGWVKDCLIAGRLLPLEPDD
ncbi:hypothetical protein ABKN59_004146 [Abortiporus biennis]